MGIDSVLAKVFGTKHERDVKAMRPLIAAINDLEPQMQELSDRGTGRADRHVQGAAGAGRHARRHSDSRVRHRARSRPPHSQHAAFRRAVDRRHRPASRQDRRDEDRRRQDAGGDAAGVSERARGQRRPRRHGQRLSGQARFRVDGPDLQGPGPDRRRHRARSGRSANAAQATTATSPTAPTTNTASITCATT